MPASLWNMMLTSKKELFWVFVFALPKWQRTVGVCSLMGMRRGGRRMWPSWWGWEVMPPSFVCEYGCLTIDSVCMCVCVSSYHISKEGSKSLSVLCPVNRWGYITAIWSGSKWESLKAVSHLVFYAQWTTVVISRRFREGVNEKACKVRLVKWGLGNAYISLVPCTIKAIRDKLFSIISICAICSKR